MKNNRILLIALLILVVSLISFNLSPSKLTGMPVGAEGARITATPSAVTCDSGYYGSPLEPVNLHVVTGTNGLEQTYYLYERVSGQYRRVGGSSTDLPCGMDLCYGTFDATYRLDCGNNDGLYAFGFSRGADTVFSNTFTLKHI